jgi:hypothetical protein
MRISRQFGEALPWTTVGGVEGSQSNQGAEGGQGGTGPFERGG